MLTIKIIAIGKIKDDYVRKGLDEFIKRLTTFCKLEIIELPESKLNNAESDYNRCLIMEAKNILEKAKGYLIGLCIEGKPTSSESLAAILNDVPLGGESCISFIIGSSYGLSDTVKSKLNYKLSISPMTFTHGLARLLIIEQIYRGFTINANIKYHK